MINRCVDNIIKEDLIVNFDVSNEKSWNLNDKFELVSLNNWNNYKIKRNKYLDFGLTAIDYGMSDSLESSITIDENEYKLKLNRIGEFDGNSIIYDDFEIEQLNDENNEAYFKFNGGYLHGFYKLHGYDYEILPYRYSNGVTFETLIKIENNSSGIFLYLGVKSEDKYNNDTFNEDNVYTSSDNPLNAIQTKEKTKEKIYNFDLGLTDTLDETFNIEDNYSGNVVAFYLNNGKVGVKYIDDEGKIINDESNTTINDGWNLLTIVYKPYSEININESNCPPTTYGDLLFYNNGRVIHKIGNFKELYFKPLKNHKEKQLGIPYNISLGGGSVGLKNSWHYKERIDELYVLGEIDEIFNFTNVDEYHYTNDYLLLQNNNHYNKRISLKYNNSIEVLGGHENTIKINFDIIGLLDKYQINDIKLILNNENVNIVDYELSIEPNTNNYNITLTYRHDKTGEQVYITPELIIISGRNFKVGGIIRLYKLNHTVYSDVEKNMEETFIETHFNKPFYGGIQKLRIYNKSLNKNEIINNFTIENKIKNIISDSGGRIIVNSVV